jgi:hypothetical protein
MRSLLGSLALAAALTLGSTSGAGAATSGSVLGAANGELDEPGSLTPLGNGRFAIQDRVYAGRSMVRSVVDEFAACLSGQLTSSEDWNLEAPQMVGRQSSTVTVRGDRSVVTLRLRGQMEYPTASGRWEIASATGRCAGLSGDGRYTASYSDAKLDFRLTLEGEVRN